MTTVKHPRIPNVTVDVPEGEVSPWVAQGWVAEEPELAEPAGLDEAATPEPSTPKRRRK